MCLCRYHQPPVHNKHSIIDGLKQCCTADNAKEYMLCYRIANVQRCCAGVWLLLIKNDWLAQTLLASLLYTSTPPKEAHVSVVAPSTEDVPLAAPPPLRRSTKIAYGIGDMSGAVVATITGFFLTAFLLDVVGLRPGVVGIIFLLSQIWDAIIHPLIGALSDRTRTRWGRKRPWLLFGALPFGVAYVLQWLVPPLSEAGLAVYYLGVSLLLKTAFSAVNVPYSALTPDLTQDYHERTQLTTYRFSFSIFGGLLSIILHPLLVGLGHGDLRLGYVWSASVWGVFIVLTVLATFRGTYELPIAPVPTPAQRTGLFGEMRECFRNRPFLLVTGIFFCSWLCLALVQNNLLLYARYAVDVERQFTFILLTFQITTIVFLSVWGRASQRWGKQRVYIIGSVIWVVGLLALFWTPRGVVAPYYAIAFLTGIGAAVAYLIPWSMLPDVIEYDELRTGQRREGLFYGMFVFLQQVGLSLGLAASNFALEAAGYLNPQQAGQVVLQPQAVQTTLRVLVSFVPAGLLLLSLPLAYAYPITRERFAEIRQRLAERASES